MNALADNLDAPSWERIAKQWEQMAASLRDERDDLAQQLTATYDEVRELKAERDDERTDRLFLARQLAVLSRQAERCWDCQTDTERLMAASVLVTSVLRLAQHTASMRIEAPREDVADVARDVLLAGMGVKS